jgi:hypothetical protein
MILIGQQASRESKLRLRNSMTSLFSSFGHFDTIDESIVNDEKTSQIACVLLHNKHQPDTNKNRPSLRASHNPNNRQSINTQTNKSK